MPSTLRLTVSAVGTPCAQDPTPAGNFPGPGLYAFLLTCDGTPLVRAGKEYGPVAVDHGYAEFHDVPAGEFLALVMLNPFGVGGETFQSNFVAFDLVRVCGCCDTVCASVYQTGWHHCFQTTVLAAEMLGRAKMLPPDVVTAVTAALGKALQVGQVAKPEGAVLEVIGRVASAFAGAASR